MQVNPPHPPDADALETARQQKLSPVVWLTLLMGAILAGPSGVLQIAGQSFTLYWSDLAVLAMAGWLFLRKKVHVPKPMKWYALYLIVAVVSLRMCPDPQRNLAILLKLRVAPALVCLFIYNIVIRQSAVRTVVLSLVLCGAAMSMMTLVNYSRVSQGGEMAWRQTAGHEIQLQLKDAAQTSFGRSNYIASMLIILLPFALYWATSQVKTRYIGWASLASILCALVATQSRGAYICLVGGFVAWLAVSYFAFRRVRGYLARVTLQIVIGVIGIMLLWQYAPQEIRSGIEGRFQQLATAFLSSDYALNRRMAWLPAIDRIQQTPILGIGFGNEPTTRPEGANSPHNLYLETVLETGVVGLILLVIFLWMCVSAWVKVLRSTLLIENRRLAAFALFAFVSAILNSLEEPSFWGNEYARLFWVILSLGFALTRAPTLMVSHSADGEWTLNQSSMRLHLIAAPPMSSR